MSTLKVNSVQHNTSGFNNVVQFTDGAGTQNGTLCRAWVNFNGTSTVAIRASFNVSSITDRGTGQYTVNFTNSLTDANYSVASSGTSSSNYFHAIEDDSLAPQSSNCRIVSRTGGGTLNDTPYGLFNFFR